MRLYRKLIRPMHSYPGQSYEPLTEPIEKEVKWYPEEERERLEKKYASYNEGSFSDLTFEVKYEPYAEEPKFKKLKAAYKRGYHKGYLDGAKEKDAVEPKYKKRMGGFVTGICPTCGTALNNVHNVKACGKCGQAVKWE